MRAVSLDEYLLIAHAVLGIEHAALFGMTRLGAADAALQAPFAGYGDHELYPTDWQKLGVLGYRLARCDALPDGNKRAAFIAMRIFAGRHDIEWKPSRDEAGPMVERAAAGTIDEDAFCEWVRAGVRG